MATQKPEALRRQGWPKATPKGLGLVRHRSAHGFKLRQSGRGWGFGFSGGFRLPRSFSEPPFVIYMLYNVIATKKRRNSLILMKNLEYGRLRYPVKASSLSRESVFAIP